MEIGKNREEQKIACKVIEHKKIMDKIEFNASAKKNTLKLYKQVTFEAW